MAHAASWTYGNASADKEFTLENKITSGIAHASGWFTAFVGSVTLEKFAVIIGIATSIGTFAVNWYYARKKAQRVEQG